MEKLAGINSTGKIVVNRQKSIFDVHHQEEL